MKRYMGVGVGGGGVDRMGRHVPLEGSEAYTMHRKAGTTHPRLRTLEGRRDVGERTPRRQIKTRGRGVRWRVVRALTRGP